MIIVDSIIDSGGTIARGATELKALYLLWLYLQGLYLLWPCLLVYHRARGGRHL